MASVSADRRFGISTTVAVKAPCACATTANITLSGEQTLDGVTTSADRVLVMNQTDSTENGIYLSDTGAWTREPDFDGNRDVVKGTLVLVAGGTIYGNSIFRVSTSDPIVIDTSSIAFSLSGVDDSANNVFTPAGSNAVATTVQAKLRELTSGTDRGATGNESTDNYTFLTNAIADAASRQVRLNLRSGVYNIGTTLALTVDGSKYARYSICGDFASGISKSTGLPGTVIKTTSNITALKTPTLTAPNNTLAYWAKDLELRNLYVEGTQAFGSGSSASVGFDLSGSQFLTGENLHAEGFGTGLLLTDGSELYFPGRTLLSNNYYGTYIKRSNNATTDMQVTFEYLCSVINDIPLVLRDVRSFWCKAGELISYTTGFSRVYVEVSSNSSIYLHNVTIENNDALPIIDVDSSGCEVLSVRNACLESCVFPLVRMAGQFDLLEVRGCALDRITSYALNANPFIKLTYTDTTNGNNRANVVVCEGNSPAHMNFAIFDSTVNKSPYKDFMPSEWQQVNPRCELDQAADNQITIGGNYLFTNTNVLCGTGRIYWDDTVAANNFVTITFARPLKGADLLWVTMIVDDNVGAVIPTAYALGGFSSPGSGEWQNTYSCKLAEFTVGARTFSKWGYAIYIENKTKSYAAGATNIEFTNFYCTSAGTTHGIEYMAVYANTKQVGTVIPTPRTMAAAPSSGLEGYAVLGQIINKTTPSAGNYAFACSVAGAPGTWVNV